MNCPLCRCVYDPECLVFTGGPFGIESHGQAAVNTIFHDTERPSQVILPLI